MIIAISAKIGAGKDTVGDIIKYLSMGADKANISFEDWDGDAVWGTTSNNFHIITWEIRKFADKLKDIVCMLIGCTREQLEDRDFKEKPLGKEWWVYNYGDGSVLIPYSETKHTEEQRAKWEKYLVKTTPRLILQLLGTEGGRKLICPDIWVNSLFADYKKESTHLPVDKSLRHFGSDWADENGKIHLSEDVEIAEEFPNWIITDCRFENEAEGVRSRGGINIRVKRPMGQRFPEEWGNYIEHFMEASDVNTISEQGFLNYYEGADNEFWKKLTHDSETGLDNYEHFDYVIDNDGSLEDLIQNVKEILIKENLIK